MAHVYRVLYRLTISINLASIFVWMTSKKQQQKRSKNAAPWPLSSLHHQALHRGIGTVAPSNHVWSRREQAHRLPGALVPQPGSSDDEAYTGVPAQLPNQFTATLPIKPSNTELSNTGVYRWRCLYNPLLHNSTVW